MPDIETTRRINSARDILVGKIPDPKSQVEQITIALIYKFMDDIDAESEQLGGVRSFFTGEFERYRWPHLMRPQLGGQETLMLYAEALSRLPENPELSPLFRDIFNNAFLPYNDPETLRDFLKVIDEFSYDGSEQLGDAFEYLLSALGAQGAAGQFRTPRHIIDFIVQAVDPQKHETILDPACGTGGFLIAARQHILNAHSGTGGGPAPLTPDEMGRLAANLQGYDISPDMVRLARVNLYLHSCPAPQIHEYDTLTSEERWEERAEVILANPPFMSPRGGVRPHGRFAVQSKRSEVLFVDYIAEHLKANGRAGVIVPEGVIFDGQNAYQQLRRMLVEQYLEAVVSLPAGVFQPYSSVKTSILFFDRARAARSGHIALLKAANDGFDLGAQRRPIDRNDLPEVLAALREWREMDAADAATPDAWPPALQALAARGAALVVDKARIAADGDYNLTGERYREIGFHGNKGWPMAQLQDVCEIKKGVAITRKQLIEGPIPVIAGGQKPSAYHNKANYAGDVVTVSATGAYAGFVSYFNEPIFASDCSVIRSSHSRVINKFVFHALKFKQAALYALQVGTGQPHVYPRDLAKFQIPLPPLEVQRELVAEIEGYQRVIGGARAVVDNYRPRIAIDPAWPVVALGEVCDINPETINPSVAYPEQAIHYADISSVENRTGRFLGYSEIPSNSAPVRAKRGIKEGDVLLSTVRPNLRAFTIVEEARERAIASTGFAVLRPRAGVTDPWFILASVHSEYAVGQMVSMMGKGAYPSINQSDVARIKIALAPLKVQQEIAAEIKSEQMAVKAAQSLLEGLEGKMRASLSKVWCEHSPGQPSE